MAEAGPGAVHRRVAAADDDDVAADLERLAEVRLLHEVDAVLDAVQVRAGDVQADGVHGAGADRDRVVVALEVLEADVAARPWCCSGTSTPRRSTRRTSISIASRGRRKAGTPMSIVPAAVREAVEDRDPVALDGQLAADGEARPGPAPITATRSVARRDRRDDVGDARGLVPLHEEPLHGPDREGPVDVAAAAGALAGGGADVGAHRRDRVRVAGEDVPLLEPALGGEVEVAAAVRPDRARLLALDVALEPGSIDRLDEELLVRVDGHDAVACVLWGWDQVGVPGAPQRPGIDAGGCYTTMRTADARPGIGRTLAGRRRDAAHGPGARSPEVGLTPGTVRAYARGGPHPGARGRRSRTPWRSLPVRLKHRIVALFGGRRRAAPAGARRRRPPRPSRPSRRPRSCRLLTCSRPTRTCRAARRLVPPGGPGAATGDPVDPCGPSRVAVDDACSLADRMNALALAAQERLREARHAYDQHVDRRERAAAAGGSARRPGREGRGAGRLPERAAWAPASRAPSRRPPASGSARSTGSTPGRARRSASSPGSTPTRPASSRPSSGWASRRTARGSRPRARRRRAATPGSRSPRARSRSARAA